MVLPNHRCVFTDGMEGVTVPFQLTFLCCQALRYALETLVKKSKQKGSHSTLTLIGGNIALIRAQSQHIRYHIGVASYCYKWHGHPEGRPEALKSGHHALGNFAMGSLLGDKGTNHTQPSWMKSQPSFIEWSTLWESQKQKHTNVFSFNILTLP